MTHDPPRLQIDHIFGDIRGTVRNPFQTARDAKQSLISRDMFGGIPDTFGKMLRITLMKFVDHVIPHDDFCGKGHIMAGKRFDRRIQHPADGSGHGLEIDGKRRHDAVEFRIRRKLGDVHGEIADALGYANQNYFTRLFTKYFGESPRAYRNKYGSISFSGTEGE